LERGIQTHAGTVVASFAGRIKFMAGGGKGETDGGRRTTGHRERSSGTLGWVGGVRGSGFSMWELASIVIRSVHSGDGDHTVKREKSNHDEQDNDPGCLADCFDPDVRCPTRLIIWGFALSIAGLVSYIPPDVYTCSKTIVMWFFHVGNGSLRRAGHC
jgi:hypothetical protein